MWPAAYVGAPRDIAFGRNFDDEIGIGGMHEDIALAADGSRLPILQHKQAQSSREVYHSQHMNAARIAANPWCVKFLHAGRGFFRHRFSGVEVAIADVVATFAKPIVAQKVR